MTKETISARPVDLNLDMTDEEFLALRAGASAGGGEMNGYFVSALRSHATQQWEAAVRNPHGGTMTGCIGAAV